MPDASYRVTIDNGDCDGVVTVNRITNTFYTGSNATYDAMNLQKLSTGGWVLYAVVISNPTSPCNPSITYTQDTAADDPIGPYGDDNAVVSAT
ncbi:MAG: hypothetical protein AAGB26_06750 [Planctomycetota bacterium]